jgi:hypothetical protein
VASVERAIGRARDPGPTPARPLAI